MDYIHTWSLSAYKVNLIIIWQQGRCYADGNFGNWRCNMEEKLAANGIGV